MLKRAKYKKLGGFSLIELSAVITVIVFVATTVITMNQATSIVTGSKETTEIFRKIHRALKRHVIEYGYYPCPADPELINTNANFGLGAGSNSGNCTAANLSVVDEDDVTGIGTYAGAIPVKTLGLNIDIIYDNWGNRIQYIVAQRVTESVTYSYEIAPATFTNSDAHITILNAYDANETIATNITNSAVSVTAAYVLVSFGQDGVGAYPSHGGATKLNADIQANETNEQRLNHAMGYANVGTGDLDEMVFNRYFVKPDAKMTATAFDDIIEYRQKYLRFPPDLNERTTINSNDINLVAWYDVNDLTTIFTDVACTTAAFLDGDRVACWHDKSVEANHIVGTVLANTPDFDLTETQNGLPTLEFGPGPSHLQINSYNGGMLSQPMTIFAVAKRDSSVGNNDKYIYDGGSGGGRIKSVVDGGNLRISAGSDLDGPAAPIVPAIHSDIFNDGADENASKFYLNGALVAGPGNTGNNSMDGITIGTNIGFGNALTGWVGEVIVYDGVVDGANRHAVEAYLAQKWGIAGVVVQ